MSLSIMGGRYESRLKRVKSNLCTKVEGETFIPQTLEDMKNIVHGLQYQGHSYHIKGGGSNTLYDGGEEGILETVIIDTRNINGTEIDKDGIVTAEMGACLAKLSRGMNEKGLSGLEFAIGIPGSVGGGVATAAEQPRRLYDHMLKKEGCELEVAEKVSDILLSVDVLDRDGRVKELKTKDLELVDRGSIFTGKDLAILSAKFQLNEQDPDIVSKYSNIIMESRVNMRKVNLDKNPYTKKILGFAFVGKHTNYKGNTLQALITSTNIPEIIKIDGMVHLKSTPGIICNIGEGKPSGYLKIMEILKNAVFKEVGFELATEVDIVY